jgi:hypothetical protein
MRNRVNYVVIDLVSDSLAKMSCSISDSFARKGTGVLSEDELQSCHTNQNHNGAFHVVSLLFI